METKFDVNDYFDLALDISVGVEDLNYTLRHARHDDIATMFVKKRLKEAKEAPDFDD